MTPIILTFYRYPASIWFNHFTVGSPILRGCFINITVLNGLLYGQFDEVVNQPSKSGLVVETLDWVKLTILSLAGCDFPLAKTLELVD